jgi:hypothetical protein
MLQVMLEDFGVDATKFNEKDVFPNLMALIASKKVPITRIVQRPGDVIITAEGAYHFGITLSVMSSFIFTCLHVN